MKIKISLYFLIALFIISCGEAEAPPAEPSVRPVKYVKVSDSQEQSEQIYTGLSKARKESALSFRVGGTINQRLVEVGDKVRKGQLLATLDPTDYKISFDRSQASVKSSEAQIRTAEAQLESAKTNYLSTQSTYQRIEKLYENNSVSLSDFEQAKTGYEAAEANYEAAKTQVEAAKASANSSKSSAQSAANQINYTRLTAPFSGIISTINVEQNEAVAQGTVVMVVSSVDNPQVEVGVPENVISEVRENAAVKVHFTAFGEKDFFGKVTEVGYSPSGSTYPVTIELSNGDEKIRPGMPVDVHFDFSDKEQDVSKVMRIPASAVGKDNKGNFVYLLEAKSDNNYITKRTSVTLGELKNAGFEVKSGLSIGQLVAAAGLNNLRDGMPVRLFNDK